MGHPRIICIVVLRRVMCNLVCAARAGFGIWIVLLFLLLPQAGYTIVNVPAKEKDDTVALGVMERLYAGMTGERYAVESLYADLYVKEYVKSERKNLLLNIIPDMTRFDRKESCYLAELFYKVRYMHNSLPEVKRVVSLSTFRHSSGEMDLVMSFMVADIYSEYLFKTEHLSPLFFRNSRYYIFEMDSSYTPPGYAKVCFRSRYDNMQLLRKGWIVVDENDGMPVAFHAEGWNEQCDFVVEYNMGEGELERALVRNVDLSVQYHFAFNKLDIDAKAEFDYTSVQLMVRRGELERKLDMTPQKGVYDSSLFKDKYDYSRKYRRVPLTREDTLFYMDRGVMPKEDVINRIVERPENSLKDILWQVGDGAISSHKLAWGSSDLRISPLIKPSYLSYNSSRGVTYRFSMDFRTRFSDNNLLYIKPKLGYSFKLKEFYWSIRSSYTLMPMKRAMLTLDVGRGNSTYNNLMLDLINETKIGALNFREMPNLYYRDFHVKQNFQMELFNGFEMQTGVNFYLRTMQDEDGGNRLPGVSLKREYRQIAPHLRFTWHPGMYYYIDNGRKVNLGSSKPRVSLDLEQGVKTLVGSEGEYTRAELDIQYKRRVQPGGSIYMRLGGGGYFHTNNIYFADYTFLKDNLLAIDDESELDGEFQLLDREWYNSANKYVRANFSYTSPFMVLHRLLPQLRFVKSESLYAGILFISHLTPYTEFGYGVETPYLNVGVFAGFEKRTFHKVGFEVSFSLFRD